MLTFSYPTLKDELIKAIESFSFLRGEIDGIDFDDFPNINEEEFDDCVIDKNSDVCLCVGEEYPYINVEEFLLMYNTKDEMKINDAQSYAKTKNEVYFLLDNSDYNTAIILENTFTEYETQRLLTFNTMNRKNGCKPKSLLSIDTNLNGKKYTCSLFKGFCIYNLLVEESGNFDDLNPSYSSYDYFVKVSCDEELLIKEADHLALAYTFELQSKLNILLPFSSGRVFFDEEDRSTESLEEMESNFFPLIHGTGAYELLSLYNTAKNTSDIDFKILGYTKVIEYIAPTIANKNLIEQVTLKLTSPNVFKPTAKFIEELGKIYDRQRNTVTKDSELIKLSITTAVTVEDILELIPKYITNKITGNHSEANNQILLETIAEAIYNTRNEIAHAKANYEKKGSECPYKYKAEFCEMLETIAIRCIRWFAMQPDDKRVVLE